jgi:hypothetical protein
MEVSHSQQTPWLRANLIKPQKPFFFSKNESRFLVLSEAWIHSKVMLDIYRL